MSGSVLNKDDFYNFLESQISRIQRYQVEEKMTLVFVKADDKLLKTINHTLEVNLRKSDLIFQGRGHTVVILPHTDKDGALHVDEMLKEFIDQELIFAFATYPEDGLTQEQLFISLANICKDQFSLDLFDYLNLRNNF